jgi:hypothetical protein
MLNELHDLAQRLKSSDVSMASWHTHFKPCPKGTTTFFALLDSLGQPVTLEPVTDRERLASIRKWEVAAGTSFPAFNVLPLYEPNGEEGKKAAVELRKVIASKSPPKSDEISQHLESLVGASTSLWAKKEPARITKCLTILASEVSAALGTPPDEFRSITELISRSGKLTAETLQTQLATILTAEIANAPNVAAELFDALFYHSGKTAKKWSLILELADRSAFAYPANSGLVQAWMNSRFQAGDERSTQSILDIQSDTSDVFAGPAVRLDESFPSVRLPVLGNVILRSMSSESPCQRRYGFADAQSCRVGQVSRQDMKNALEWIGHPDRREKTWCDVSSLNGVSGVLFAYPSQTLEVAPELAGLIVGLDAASDPDGANFEQCARRVTASLTALVQSQPHESPNTEVRVFVLSKPDGFRTKVLSSGRYSVNRLLTSANDWMTCGLNVPPLQIRQFGANKGDKRYWAEPLIPYPAEVVGCLNTAWERSGTHAEHVPGFGIGDGLGLLLEDGVVLNAITTRAIRTLITNSLSLVLALGHAHRQGQVHPMGRKYGKQSLLLPSIFGLLLAKLGRLKGHYMKGPPFLVGRLLSVADQLHLQYCHGVRKGQVPPQLVGNALVTAAMDSPVRAVALIWQRIKPYHAWAQTVQGGDEVRLAKWLLGELGKISAQMSEQELPPTCGDAEKAEMLLGYLARSEKEKDTEPTQLTTEGASA